MSNVIANEFTEYELTEDEILAGQMLTVTQVQVLMNMRAAYARQKLNMQFDPNNIQQFLQIEAEVGGKLAVLQDILDAHAIAAEALFNRMEFEKNQQPRSPDDRLDGNIFGGI